jgi:hypothetical protein
MIMQRNIFLFAIFLFSISLLKGMSGLSDYSPSSSICFRMESPTEKDMDIPAQALKITTYDQLMGLENTPKNRQKIIRIILKLNRAIDNKYYYGLLRKLVDASSQTGFKIAKKSFYVAEEAQDAIENKLLLLSSLIKKDIIIENVLNMSLSHIKSQNLFIQMAAQQILASLANKNLYIVEIKNYLTNVFVTWLWDEDFMTKVYYFNIFRSLPDEIRNEFKKELLENTDIAPYVKKKIIREDVF